MEILRFSLNDPAEYKLPPVSLDPLKWRNGLVVRMPNHLGDAVMALPALCSLGKMLPEHCGLFVVAPEMFRQFYAQLPAVASFVGLRKAHANWTLSEIREVKKLRAGVAVLFNNSPRDAIAMRLGGDEFVLFLYGYDSDDELMRAIKTLQYIQDNSMATLEKGLTVPLEFSLGYCLVGDNTDYQQLFKEADEMMYKDKAKRKNGR